MKLGANKFYGMMPIVDNTLLPTGYASTAVNTRLVSGSIQGYFDIGNPFQLAKPASIFTLAQAANGDWLQFYAAELATYAFDIRCVPGPIPADPTGRRYISGYNALSYGASGVFQGPSNQTSVPQFTNTFYATDPSQQGTAALGAFPYKTFPLGVSNPLNAPAVSVASAAGITTVYEYAQETSVNNASFVNPGAGYIVGDVLSIPGGTLLVTGYPATITVNEVNTTGVVGSIKSASGSISLTTGGFYESNQGPGGTFNNTSGLVLPAANISLLSVTGFPNSGTIYVQNTSGANQTVSYTGISGLTLTGCTGGSGNVTNGAPVQPATVTLAASGGTGSGATFTINVIQQITVDAQGGQSLTLPPGWGFIPYGTLGTGSYGAFLAPTAVNIGRYSQQWQIINGQGNAYVAYSTTAFSLKTASGFMFQTDTLTMPTGSSSYADILIQFCGTFNGMSQSGQVVGPTLVIDATDGNVSLYQSITLNNEAPVSGSPVASQNYAFAGSTQYRVTITGVVSENSVTPGFSVIVSIALTSAPGTPLVTLTGFVPYSGEAMGLGLNNRNGTSNVNFENVLITVTQPQSQLTEEFVNYVVTFDQQIPFDVLTQESGPSDPSSTVAVTFNESTNPPARATASVVLKPVPSGEFIAYENLYRLVEDSSGGEEYTLVTVLAAWNMTAVTGSFTPGSTVTGQTSTATATVLSYGGGVLVVSGVEGLFQQGEVIEQDAGDYGTYSTVALNSVTITYADSAQDNAIGPDVLISQTWMPPPANLQGINTAPNGFMFGYFDNVLCLSAAGYPHAWPVGNQYAIDTIIKAALPIDTTILILDQANPYTAWGTDPTAFSMSKEVSNQGCTSTRGAYTHKTYGVVFPSSNGIAYYRGQGQLDLVRVGPTGQPPFSYEQWTALTPSSIQAVMHDDNYFFWYNNGTKKSGFVLDMEPNGFGLHELDFHVTESYVDQTVDALYFTPDFSIYPINGSVIAAAQNIVSQWEYAATMRPRTWERDEFLLPRPASFSRARVRYKIGSSSDSVNLAVSSEAGTEFNGDVTSQSMFIIGNLGTAIRWNAALTMIGEVVVNSLEISETAADMLGDS